MAYKYGQMTFLFSELELQKFPSQLPFGEREKPSRKMTESEGNGEKIPKRRRERNLLAFTGAAALLALAVNLGIAAYNARKQNKKKKGF